MRLLLSVFLFLAVPAFAAVQPYKPSRVGNTFSFPKSSPSTTYRDMGTTRSAYEMGANRTRYLTHDARMAFERSGITIDAKLKTGITKDTLKNGFKSAFKKGMFSPAGLAKAALVDTLGQALIDAGLQWQEDQQQWGLGKDPETIFNVYSYAGFPSDYAGPAKNVTFSQVYDWIKSRWPETSHYAYAGVSNGRPYYRIYGNSSGYSSNGALIYFNIVGQTQPSVSPPTDDDIDSVYDDYVDLMPLDAVLKMADLADIPRPDYPDSVTIPQDQQTQYSQPREISRENDPVTGKEKIKTEQEKVDAQVTNNNQVTYNSTTITKTYLGGVHTGTETKDNDPPPTDPGTDYPEIPDFELPKEKAPPFTVSLPSIPTTFNCTNPSFELTIMTSFLSFPLPLCEWIEHFRALFEWFWSVMTAIVIYVMARGVNLKTGEAK